LAESMNHAGQMLAEAGVMTSKLGQIVEASLGLGCLAAKPTGAGGGGCVLALLPNENWAGVLQKLENTLGKNNIYKAIIS